MRRTICCLFALGLAAVASALAKPAPAPAKRVAVLVSDLHLGLGCPDGKCHPMEDARWPVAWQGFLDHVTAKHGRDVDLVILGDFLELWQHPEVRCDHGDPDLGCSPAEAKRVVATTVAAHSRELAALKRFAEEGNHRVFVVPGNHDAALLVADVRQPLVDALGMRDDGRIRFVADGRWISTDKRIAGEHGHQIGPDPNRFEGWPTVTTERKDIGTFLVRTWGEHFVQRLYNDVEAQYPAIDNLTPESAGVKLYAAERGKLGTLADLGRFVFFNLFQTSWSQEKDFGPAIGEEEAPKEWDESAGREKGYYLVAGALPPGDPLRAGLLEGRGEDWDQLRKELSRRMLAPDEVSREEVFGLCAQADQYAAEHPGTQVTSCKADFGASLLAKPFSSILLRRYLEKEAKNNGALRHFVYGHTHGAKVAYRVKVDGSAIGTVAVVNTGAFQRLGPALAGGKLSDARPESLSPCYSYVVVQPDDGVLLLRWRQNETEATGQAIGACDPQCLPIAAGCG